MKGLIGRLLGRHPEDPVAVEVQEAEAERDRRFSDLGQAHDDLGAAIHEVDELRAEDGRKKNGVIAAYQEAEANRPQRRPR